MATLVALGLYLYFRGLRALRLKRYLQNVPRSTIRSAAIGPVEISGKAVGPYTIVPPNGTQECLCYWRITEAKTLQFVSAPLYLDDGTGKLMISPRALDMSLIPALLEPGIYGAVSPGETIFVLGSLEQNPWVHPQEETNRDELTRIGPGFVSRAEAEVLRSAASPLFYPAEVERESEDRFDLFPHKILMKGSGPFIISRRSQREVLAALKWKIYSGVWGGPVLTLFGLANLILFGPHLWHELLY
jgi:hypothetical protein